MNRRSRFLLALVLPVLASGCGSGTFGIFAASDSSSSSSNAKTVGTTPTVTDDDFRSERALASPAAIRFDLTDQEGDPADVLLEYSENGVDFDSITLAAGSASLTQVPSNQESEVLWNFAADLPNGEGYTRNLTMRLTVVGGISPADATGIEVGNDVSVFSPPTFEQPEIAGIAPVIFSVEDTEGDPIRVKVEYQIDGDTTWLLARNAEITDPLDEGDAFTVDTDADGDEEVFFWDTGFATAYQDQDGDEVVERSDTGVLAAREASVRLRFTLREDFSQTERVEIVEIVEQDPLLVVDNNEAPIGFFDGALFVNGQDETRTIAILFEVRDEESDPVRVVFQWKRTTQPDFPPLPDTVAEIEEILADPGRRDLLQICTEAAPAFGGLSAPPPASLSPFDSLSLPELWGQASALLPRDGDSSTLEILRASQVPRSVASDWAVHGFTNALENPSDALPIGNGPTALVLEAPTGATWELQEVDLTTGAVVQGLKATGSGNPTAMDFEPGDRSVVIASGIGELWQVHRVELSTSTVALLITAQSGETEHGTIRDIESIGTGAALVTVGQSLIRLNYEQPQVPFGEASGGYAGIGPAPAISGSVERGLDLPSQHDLPYAVTLRDDLATPWGIVSDPLRTDRIYLAERDHDHGDGRYGRILTFELDTYSARDVFLDQRSTLPGAGFDSPTAIALERNGAQLLVLTDSNPGDSVRELHGVRIHGPTPGAVFELTSQLPSTASTLAVGPDNQRLIAAAGDLFVGGGVAQRRMIQHHDPGHLTVRVAREFEPVPLPNAPWRIRQELGFARSSPAGQSNVFVWDTGDVLGGKVQLRITPLDTDIGVGTAVQEPKRLSLFKNPVPLGEPDEGGLSCATGDIDGDGRPDVVAENLCDKGLDLFYQSARGHLSLQPDVRLGIGMIDTPGFTRVADLNGDGEPDIITGAGEAIANPCGGTGGSLGLSQRLFVFYQPPGPAGFADTAPWLELGADSPWVADVLDVDVADLDRDGFLDVLATSGSAFGAIADVVAVFVQEEDGFHAVDQPEVVNPLHRWPGATLNRTDTADLDGDGWLDLACQAWVKNQTAGLGMVLLNETGAFTRPPGEREAHSGSRRLYFRREPDLSILLPASSGFGVETADLDRDGRHDLSFPSGALDVGTFELALFFQHPELPLQFSSQADTSLYDPSLQQPLGGLGIDVDGDGWLDLVSPSPGTSSLSLFRQRSPRRFSTTADVVLRAGETAIQHTEAVDLEGNGSVDLISIGFVVLVDRQSVPGSFPAAPEVIIGDAALTDRPSSLVAADLNGDGCTDLVTSNEETENLTLFFQGDPGQYSAIPDVVLGSRGVGVVVESSTPAPRDLDVADLNGDGLVDIACVNDKDIDLALFYQPDGGFFDVRFANVTISTRSVTGATGVVAADLDGDGQTDLITANRDGGDATVFSQRPGGGFSSEPTLRLGAPSQTPAPSSLAIVDLNADGTLDLVLADASANLHAFVQPPSGWSGAIAMPDLTLSSGQTAASADAEGRGQVVACDLDVDGLVDMSVPLERDGGLAIFFQPDSGFAGVRSPDQTLGVSSDRILRPSDLATVDVDADGLPDLISSNLADSEVTMSSGSRNTTVFLQHAIRRFSAAPDIELAVPGGILDANQEAAHQALAVADLNGDGEPDVAAALRRPGPPDTFGVSAISDVIAVFISGK